MMSIHRVPSFARWIVLAIAIALMGTAIVTSRYVHPASSIKVGVLHSRTGTMAVSEASVIAATLFAIREINEQGGVLGRPLEPVVADGKSDWPTFARQAERLITEEKVHVVFGCWTSASRKTVRPIFEKYKQLLVYPVQYEGLERSPNIVYTGSAANQQEIPGAIWAMREFGNKLFFVGSDYVYPRSIGAILKQVLPAVGAQIVGEEYIPLGQEDVEPVLAKIAAAKPNVIINTINGSTNLAFFKGLKRMGSAAPVMSYSISDSDFMYLGIENIAGSYTCWNYYQTIADDINQTFVKKIKQAYGKSQAVSDPMEAAYFGVHLWARAVRAVGSTDKDAVLSAMRQVIFRAPEGYVALDLVNHHTFKTVRIARVNKEGASDIVWETRTPTEPEAYPSTMLAVRMIPGAFTPEQWDSFLATLYQQWGNKWSA